MEFEDDMLIEQEPYLDRMYQMTSVEIANHYFIGKARYVARLLASTGIVSCEGLRDDIQCYLESLEADLNKVCPYIGRPVVARSNYHIMRSIDEDGSAQRDSEVVGGTKHAVMTGFVIKDYARQEAYIRAGLVVCSRAERRLNEWVQYETPLSVGDVKPLLPALS